VKAISWLVFVLAFGNLSARAEFDWKKAQKQYEDNVRIASRYPFREFEKAAEVGDIKSVKRLLDDGIPADLPLPWPKESFEGIPPCERAIHHAAAGGHIEVVRLLLDRGANPNGHAGERNFTPLHTTNNIEVAKLLISRGADVNARDDMGAQPIHYAAESLALIKFLIEKGADPLAEDDQKEQPIHMAVKCSTAEVVLFFLSHNAKVDATIQPKEDNWGKDWQPIHFAVSRSEAEESLEITELLISKGADHNAITAEGETPLHLAQHSSITKLLLRHGAKPDMMTTGTVKKKPIHHFAMQGDVESIKLLLDSGVNLEARSGDEDETTTPLDTAVYWQKPDAAKFLLERGAKITERTMKNAIRFDNRSIETLNLLHQHGSNVSTDVFLMVHPQAAFDLLPLLNQENKDLLLKNSARIIAESATRSNLYEPEGGLAAIKALVALGAKADQPWNGFLPIHHAVTSGQEAVIEFFISIGQPIDAKGTWRDDDNEPPIFLTEVQPIHIALGSPEMVSLLIKKGAKIDAETGEGWQLIHLASAYGDKRSLEAVIKAAGDPKARTRDGKTPFQLATEFKNEETAAFLKNLP